MNANRLILAVLVALLTACGGGGGEPVDDPDHNALGEPRASIPAPTGCGADPRPVQCL